MKRLIITEEEKISIKGLYEQKGLVTILKGLGKKLGLGVEKKVGLGVSKQIAKTPTKIKNPNLIKIYFLSEKSI